jgi:rubrerythrin
MALDTFDEIIQFAIEKEIEAQDFYKKASEEESLSGSRQMLLDFANEEKKHQEMLENLDKQTVMETKIEPIPDLKRSDYMKKMDYTPGMGYRDILITGMKREEEAVNLYENLKARTENDEIKQVFQLLVQEESKHKLALEKLYDDFMAQMGD